MEQEDNLAVWQEDRRKRLEEDKNTRKQIQEDKRKRGQYESRRTVANKDKIFILMTNCLIICKTYKSYKSIRRRKNF